MAILLNLLVKSVLGEREQVSRVTTVAWKPEKNSTQCAL